jgi:cytochrome c oxidase cbb3-type subunit 2
VAAGVAAFLALVWIDSAAFAAIQQRPDLAAATWGTASGKLAIGAAHLLAAVAAGALLDAGRLLPLLAGSAGIFALALPAIESGAGSHPTWGRLWGLLYACGISAYSTALVTWPGRIGRKVGQGGEPPAGMPPRWRAALLYGVAGWLGSALGVGMAEDLRRIPTAAVAAAVAVVWIACALLRRGRHLWRVWGPTLGLTLLFCGAVLAVRAATTGPDPTGVRRDPDVERGRRVYIAEGCIHCHSQYVRPPAEGNGIDEARWGPPRALDRGERPPLVGVRRQGPDLTNVGARRSAAWQRAHLIDPRALDPGSRMPSYAHLFREAEPKGGQDGPERTPSRGDDLVAYLGSLGSPAVIGAGAALLPGPAEHAGASAARGERLFGRYCAACHGEGGRGDGPLAEELASPAERRVMDLGKGPLWSVTRGVDGADEESERRELARTIGFGLPGTSMPGHESLTRQQIADLARFVEGLVPDPETSE